MSSGAVMARVEQGDDLAYRGCGGDGGVRGLQAVVDMMAGVTHGGMDQAQSVGVVVPQTDVTEARGKPCIYCSFYRRA
jgi:hypothetical protein